MSETLQKSKIRIIDNNTIRTELASVIITLDKAILSKWAISNSLRIMDLIDYDVICNNLINKGIEMNQLCICKLITINELREIGFEIHRLAKSEENLIIKYALRSFGHAISVAHMKEHALVSSDYVIKALNLLHENNFNIASHERNIQLLKLKELTLQK